MKKYYEARFGGFTKSGRVKVIYNEYYPFGVSWAVAYFKPENVPEGVVIPKLDEFICFICGKSKDKKECLCTDEENVDEQF